MSLKSYVEHVAFLCPTHRYRRVWMKSILYLGVCVSCEQIYHPYVVTYIHVFMNLFAIIEIHPVRKGRRLLRPSGGLVSQVEVDASSLPECAGLRATERIHYDRPGTNRHTCTYTAEHTTTWPGTYIEYSTSPSPSHTGVYVHIHECLHPRNPSDVASPLSSPSTSCPCLYPVTRTCVDTQIRHSHYRYIGRDKFRTHRQIEKDRYRRL